MNEIWKTVTGHEEYQVSSLGNVRKIYPKIIPIKPKRHTCGYLQLNAHLGKRKYKNIYIHRLVASLFIRELKHKECVNHKNGIKTDNSISNLEIVSYSENIKHAISTKLIKRSNHGSNLLTKDDVLTIRFFSSRKTNSILAKIYNRHSSNIIEIASGRSYSFYN